MVCVSKTLITYTLATVAAHAAQQGQLERLELMMYSDPEGSDDYNMIFCSSTSADTRSSAQPKLEEVILTKIQSNGKDHIQVKVPNGRTAKESTYLLTNWMPAEKQLDRKGLMLYPFYADDNITIALNLSHTDYCELKNFLGLKANYKRSIKEQKEYKDYLIALINKDNKDPARLEKSVEDAFEMARKQTIAFKDRLLEIGKITKKLRIPLNGGASVDELYQRLVEIESLEKIVPDYIESSKFDRQDSESSDDDGQVHDQVHGQVALNHNGMIAQQQDLKREVKRHNKDAIEQSLETAFIIMGKQAAVSAKVMRRIRQLCYLQEWNTIHEIVTNFINGDDNAYVKHVDGLAPKRMSEIDWDTFDWDSSNWDKSFDRDD